MGKKIRGKLHFFDKWEDPDAAIDSYKRQKDDLPAGRKLKRTSSIRYSSIVLLERDSLR